MIREVWRAIIIMAIATMVLGAESPKTINVGGVAPGEYGEGVFISPAAPVAKGINEAITSFDTKDQSAKPGTCVRVFSERSFDGGVTWENAGSITRPGIPNKDKNGNPLSSVNFRTNFPDSGSERRMVRSGFEIKPCPGQKSQVPISTSTSTTLIEKKP